MARPAGRAGARTGGKAKGVHVEMEGQEELRRAFARLEVHALAEVKEAVAESAREMLAEAKQRVPVDEGTTKKSLKIITRLKGLSATIGTGWYVARLIEFGHRISSQSGTRKGKRSWKKKQVKNMVDGGHVPAKPFLNPAFEVVRPKYIERLKTALNQAGRKAEQ